MPWRCSPLPLLMVHLHVATQHFVVKVCLWGKVLQMSALVHAAIASSARGFATQQGLALIVIFFSQCNCKFLDARSVPKGLYGPVCIQTHMVLSFQSLAAVNANNAKQSGGWSCVWLAKKTTFESSVRGHHNQTRQTPNLLFCSPTSPVIHLALTFLCFLFLPVWSLTHYGLLCAILASLCSIDVSPAALLCLLRPYAISQINPKLMNVFSLWG